MSWRSRRMAGGGLLKGGADPEEMPSQAAAEAPLGSVPPS